jgi:hypothetical protein
VGSDLDLKSSFVGKSPLHSQLSRRIQETPAFRIAGEPVYERSAVYEISKLCLTYHGSYSAPQVFSGGPQTPLRSSALGTENMGFKEISHRAKT